MSLRTRLFLLFAAVLAVTALAQGLLTHRLAAELSRELGQVALRVGREVVSVFAFQVGTGTELAATATASGASAISPFEEPLQSIEGGPAAGGDPSVPAASAAPAADELSANSLPAHRVLVVRQGSDVVVKRGPPASQPPSWVAAPDETAGETNAAGGPDGDANGDLEAGPNGVASGGLGAGPDGRKLQLSYRFESVQTDDEARVVRREVHTAAAPPAELQLLLERAAGRSAGALADPADVLTLVGPDLHRRIEIPTAGMETALARFRSRLLGGSLALALLAVALAAVVAHRVSRPLGELASAARAVGGGGLGIQVPLPARRQNGGGDEVVAAIAAFNQMSSRLAALDAEARSMRERQHLAELGELARGLAHTLRNPLHGLGLAVDSLAARAVDGEGRELAATARAQIARVDHTVRALLALAGHDGANPEPVELGSLVQGVALEALQDAHGRVAIEVAEVADSSGVAAAGAPVAGALPGRAGAVLCAVPAELRAIVQALVVNAVEASPEGGVVEIAIEPAGAGSERVRLVVADRGSGVPEEVRARLFEPHVTTKAAGSGMGLYLAHRLAVGRYRGELELGDRPGGGTLAVLALADREASPMPAGSAAQEAGVRDAAAASRQSCGETSPAAAAEREVGR